jgi:outer membrane protein TolC
VAELLRNATSQENMMSLLQCKSALLPFFCTRVSLAIALFLFVPVLCKNAFAQESPAEHQAAPTGLSELLSEAEKNNPQIEAARQNWQAAKQVPTQVSTLPDPQFTLQHLSVGSPRPFAGYTNSDFAYIGLGCHKTFPYPGKVKLRGEIAKREVEVSQQQNFRRPGHHSYEVGRTTAQSHRRSSHLSDRHEASSRAACQSRARANDARRFLCVRDF